MSQIYYYIQLTKRKNREESKKEWAIIEVRQKLKRIKRNDYKNGYEKWEKILVKEIKEQRYIQEKNSKRDKREIEDREMVREIRKWIEKR